MNPNPPAFPCSKESVDEANMRLATTTSYAQMSGMTLRQWYAGMALSGLVVTAKELSDLLTATSGHQSGPKLDEFIAAMAFQYADAMIAVEKMI